MSAELTAVDAVSLGGWPAAYAVVLAVASCRSGAAAIVDPNGDEADINLDVNSRSETGGFVPGYSSNGVGAG